ncbi:MAG: CarD family transcriptional regulator [Anaerolineales bacterium]
MADNAQLYSRGDWVVHLSHGVGQIKGKVRKRLGGRRIAFYKVEAGDNTLWVPLDKADTGRLRPVSTRSEFKKALQILQKPPRQVDKDAGTWKRRIAEAKEDGSPVAICHLICDLSALKAEKKLTYNEKQTLLHFMDILLKEWSVCLGIGVDEAQHKLDDMLQKSQARLA